MGDQLRSGQLAKQAYLREVHHFLIESDVVEPVYDQANSGTTDEEDEEEANRTQSCDG